MRPAILSFTILLLTFGLSGCLRPGEERAQRDLQIGQQTMGASSVRVENGLAAVQDFSDERLIVWASAPSLTIDLEVQDPASEFALEIHNCMPAGELRAPQGVVVTRIPQPEPTRCSYTLTGLPESGTLNFATSTASDVNPFRFAVLSDVQEAIGEVQDVFETINAQEDIEFLLGAGDLTEQGTLSQLERYQQELRMLDIPYYTTLGNHELGTNPPPFQDLFGRASFSFEHRGIRFTLLDSGSAGIDPLVFDELDRWLKAGETAPHVVAMHVPPIDPVGVRNGSFASRNEGAKLLSKLASHGVDLTLYGHVHTYFNFENAGIPAHISGGGGAVPERFDNIERHILVIDVTPSTSDFDVSVVRVDL